MAESRIGPKFRQPTFNCNTCSSFTQRTSQSCLNHSQEPCEWVNADLGVLLVESEQHPYKNGIQRFRYILHVLPSDLVIVLSSKQILSKEILNANDMNCTCQHQGCIICDQQYLHSSKIHPIKVRRGIIVNLQILVTPSDGTPYYCSYPGPLWPLPSSMDRPIAV